MLAAALLWYRQFKKDLTEAGYEFNPYDPCVCNKLMHEGKQHTVAFHVDDLIGSCADQGQANTELENWLNNKYGSLGEVKVTRGDVHDYLGMRFDFSIKGQVTVDMTDYIANMIDECSVKFTIDDTTPTPAAGNLSIVKEDSPLLSQHHKEEFHTIVAQGLFVCCRVRPDLHPTNAVLRTRV